jgi:phenol 2-monooxygenase (NADPH)
LQLGGYLDSTDGPVRKYTPIGTDIDSLIEPIVILHGDRHTMEQEQLHPYFWPVTGKWQIKDLHKTFVDEESYNSGHGKAYEHYGVDPDVGAMAIIRPDHNVSKVVGLDDFDAIGAFFDQFMKKTSLLGSPVNGTPL